MKKNFKSVLMAGCVFAVSILTFMPAQAADTTDTTIRMVNSKIEIDPELQELAEMYEEETGVKVEIESFGPEVDVLDVLKNYYQGGHMPDIIVCTSAYEFETWSGLLVDMSDQDWTLDTEDAYIIDEGTVGYPYTVEAIGLSYNEDILEKAGVDPESITGPESMREAFETIDAQKEELGITAVIGYFTDPETLSWSTGNHIFCNYLDAGLERNDMTYIDMISDGGKLDKSRFTAFAEMIELFNEFSDPDLLVTGTYDQQVQNFSAGEYAFVTQGNWISPLMTSDYAQEYEQAGSFKVGMIPYAFSEGIDTILTDAPSWWSVFNKSENVDEALDFLQWMTTDEAQQILVEEGGCLSPFMSCNYDPNDPFSESLDEWIKSEKTSSWHWVDLPEGFADNYTGKLFADFASGVIPDVKTFVEEFQDVCELAYH